MILITEQQTALLTFAPPTNDDEENIDALLERLDKQMKETYRIADKYNLAGNQNVTLGDNLVTAIENALQNISDAINQIDTEFNLITGADAEAHAGAGAASAGDDISVTAALRHAVNTLKSENQEEKDDQEEEDTYDRSGPGAKKGP